MYNHSQLRNHLIEQLANKRNYKQEIKALVSQYEYVAFYGCGVFFHSIIDNWNMHIGRRIDFCCDRNRAKWGKCFRGIKCISLKELMAIKDKCAVFVTVGDFKPVFSLLTESGFPSINQIYKYDLVSSGFLANHDHGEIVDKLCQTYEILSDKQSKKVFDAIVNRVLGSGENISIMANICENNQYFPVDIIKLSENESFVDAGAFTGDTVKDFVGRTRAKFDRIFSFELDAINFKVLQDNVEQMPAHDRIKIFNLGIWESECDLAYSIDSLQSSVGGGDGKGHVVPLDDFLKEERFTYIKMDIEGAELQALRGARNIIQTQKPRLAICIYHDFKHLWEIPLYLKELVPKYKIYLRHHTKLEYETVCYAMI